MLMETMREKLAKREDSAVGAEAEQGRVVPVWTMEEPASTDTGFRQIRDGIGFGGRFAEVRLSLVKPIFEKLVPAYYQYGASRESVETPRMEHDPVAVPKTSFTYRKNKVSDGIIDTAA